MDTIIIIGLGNPILSDDAVGILVVRDIERRMAKIDGLVFVEASVGGLDLVELLAGHAGALLVDAAVTGRAEPGEVLDLDPAFLEDTTHLGTTGVAHQVDLATAWQLGRRLGWPLPIHLRVLAVEAEDVKTFSEELTPTLQNRFADIVDTVEGAIREMLVLVRT